MKENKMYTFSTELNQPIDEVISILTEALAEGGLGIVSDINVQSIMTSKLQEDFRPYRIIGVCAPGLAKSLISIEAEIGTLLPCNIVAQELDGRTQINFMDPVTVLGLANQPAINDIAQQVQDILKLIQAKLHN
jgi:uncharacterized protein (DUF302 family)